MKQLKSSHQDLREFTLKRITAQHIAESLTSFDTAADAHTTQLVLEQHNFDVAGARENGQVIGYIIRSDLSDGTVGDHRIDFTEGDILAASTPLVDVLRQIRDSERTFVEVLGHVGGIITRSDLQKMPIRLWLFGLISLLEMQMLRVIREHFANQQWVELLTPKRIEAARGLFEKRQTENLEIDLADCLQLCDKKNIFAATPTLLQSVGYDSKSSFRSTLEEIEKLRNNLAHSQDIPGEESEKLVDLAEMVEELLASLEGERY